MVVLVSGQHGELVLSLALSRVDQVYSNANGFATARNLLTVAVHAKETRWNTEIVIKRIAQVNNLYSSLWKKRYLY